MLRKSIADASPRVRLEAVVAASYVPSDAAADIVAQAADQPRDRFLDYAIAQSLRVLKPHWLPALTNGTLELASHPARLELLVKSDGTPDTLRALRGLANGPARENFLVALAEVGDANDLARLLDAKAFTNASGYDAAQHTRVLAAIEKPARIRNLRPAGDVPAALAALWQLTEDTRLRAAVLRLAILWKVNAMSIQGLFAAACTPNDEELRIAGATALAVLGGTNAPNLLTDLARPGRVIGERIAATIGFATFDLPRAAGFAADILASDKDGRSVTNLIPPFLTRKGGAAALAAALGSKPPTTDAARLALRLINSAGQQDASLVAELNKASGLSGAPLQLSAAQVQEFAQDVHAQGNAARGAQIFLRADLSCVACHAVGGQGGNIGPSLDGIGAGQPLDFIIGSVLEPNKEVKESFEAIEITTKDGETYQGYRIRSDKTELVLRDVTLNKEVRLRRDQIADQQNRGSVMPAGLVDHLTREELRDLFRYLSELGKAKP